MKLINVILEMLSPEEQSDVILANLKGLGWRIRTDKEIPYATSKDNLHRIYLKNGEVYHQRSPADSGGNFSIANAIKLEVNQEELANLPDDQYKKFLKDYVIKEDIDSEEREYLKTIQRSLDVKGTHAVIVKGKDVKYFDNERDAKRYADIHNGNIITKESAL